MHHGHPERQTHVHTGLASLFTAFFFLWTTQCNLFWGLPNKVCVEGRLYLEFMFDDMMRIKTWHFSIRQHREVLPRSILAMHVSAQPKYPKHHAFAVDAVPLNSTSDVVRHALAGSSDAGSAG